MQASLLIVFAASAAVNAALTAPGTATGSAAACANFTLPLNLTDVNLQFATYYAAGSLVNLTSGSGSVTTTKLPSFCRVALKVSTNVTANTSATTEVWLPDNWNGRSLAVGNGGWSGGVVYNSISFDAVANGYAGMSTNTGHNSTSLDGTWGVNSQSVIDFGHRAMHLSQVAAKAIVQQYYKQASMKNYYLGCSTGGRQGLRAASLYPFDFDGVVVGSPANRMSRLQPWSIWINNIVQPVNGSTWIPASMWPIIHAEVLRQCDALDGLVDGVVNNPYACGFRPEAIACSSGQNGTSCLTTAQIATLRKIYNPYYETNDLTVFDGYAPGGELAYYGGLVGPNLFQISPNYYQYFVRNDSNWNPRALNLSDILLGDQINPGQMDITTPDLSAFAARGGKVIHYVGLSDQLISPGNSISWYNELDAFTKTTLNISTSSYYRLFTVPGMGHCSGLAGPNAFGGESQANIGMPPLVHDAMHDIQEGMVAWIENGTAPSMFVGANYNNNNVSQGLNYTRPLCQYPAFAQYTSGNSSDYKSFNCSGFF